MRPQNPLIALRGFVFLNERRGLFAPFGAQVCRRFVFLGPLISDLILTFKVVYLAGRVA